MIGSDNPYVAPRSAVKDVPLERQPAKRPRWVWVIALLLGVFGVATVVILVLAMLEWAPDFAATYERLGRFNFAMTLIWACLTIGAAILLFMLRLRAIPLLWLAAGIVGTFDVFALVSMGPYSLFRTIFHAVFWGLILSYV
jgi:hypothetical protein